MQQKGQKMRKGQKLVRRYTKCQETPLFIYSSLKIYSSCHSRNVNDCFFSVEIYASHGRKLELSQNSYEYLR